MCAALSPRLDTRDLGMASMFQRSEAHAFSVQHSIFQLYPDVAVYPVRSPPTSHLWGFLARTDTFLPVIGRKLSPAVPVS